MLRTAWISLALVMGCTQGGRPSHAVVVAIDAPPETLDRRMALSANAMRVAQLVTPGLTRIDAAGAAVPDLARSFLAVDDLTWRFELREGLRFSDGAPLTAADVVATYTSVLDPALRSPHRGGYAYVERVEATDPVTVVFHLARPFGALPVDTTLGVLPARLTAPELADEVRRSPVGAGPYRVASWDADERLVLAPNPLHFRGPPAHALEIRTVRDETTRVLELRKGRVDVAFNAVTPALLPALREDPRLEVDVGPGAGVSYLMFNLEDPRLRDVRVRQAIALAVDREQLVRLVHLGRARALEGGPIPHEHWAHADAGEIRGVDLSRARELLRDAGLEGGFDLELRAGSAFAYQVRAAEVIKQQLAPLGVRVHLRAEESGVFFDALARGDFQAAVAGWVGFVDPDEYLYELFRTGGNYNQQGFSDPRVDGLLEEGRRTLDRERRRAIYREVQELVTRAAPMVFLHVNPQTSAWRDRVSGFRPLPTASTRTLREVWKR